MTADGLVTGYAHPRPEGTPWSLNMAQTVKLNCYYSTKYTLEQVTLPFMLKGGGSWLYKCGVVSLLSMVLALK
jgi:hypothetical protein